MLKKIVLILFLVATVTSMALAQEDTSLQAGTWGIAVTDVFGMLAVRDAIIYDQAPNTWIEGHYFLTGNIALKPALFIAMVTSERENNMTGGSSTTENGRNDDGSPDYGIRIAVDYYIPVTNNMYMYVGPSLAYLAGSYSQTNSVDDAEETADYSEFLLGVRLGAQYMITARFGIFADIGIYYDMVTVDVIEKNAAGVTTLDRTNEMNIFQTMTSGLGVIFYF